MKYPCTPYANGWMLYLTFKIKNYSNEKSILTYGFGRWDGYGYNIL